MGQPAPSPDVIKSLLKPIVDLKLTFVCLPYSSRFQWHGRDVAANVVNAATRAGVDCSAICRDLECPDLADTKPSAPTKFAGLYEIRKAQWVILTCEGYTNSHRIANRAEALGLMSKADIAQMVSYFCSTHISHCTHSNNSCKPTRALS